VSSVEDTPIFDELVQRSGITPAIDTGQHSQLEHDEPVTEPVTEPVPARNPPADSSPPPTISPKTPPQTPLKIIVTGGAEVGKTTFVGSVSEVAPLDTEAWLTETEKATAPVAMDFGRIALHPDLVLYLFGTAEQPPSWLGGALGAVVLVDIRRIQESFAAVDYFENDSEIPFIVAVNMFDGRLVHDLDKVREALTLDPAVPLTACDARDPGSAASALSELVAYAKNLTDARRAAPGAGVAR